VFPDSANTGNYRRVRLFGSVSNASRSRHLPLGRSGVKSLETPLAVAAQSSQTHAARRWFGTGRSVDRDANAAGAQAASAALAGRTASLVVVFCPATIDMAAMLDGVRAVVCDVPLIGGTGLAQYAAEGSVEPAVIVSALGGEGFEVRTSVAMNVSADQRAAGEQVAEAVEMLTREHQMLLLLCDGVAGEQHEMVRGAYSVVGATVPLAGGCTSDDLNYVRTSQFFSDADGVHVLSDAVVAAAIGSDAPMGIGVAHGWRKVGEPMVVTSSKGGHVGTLDGQPALDVFLDRIGATRSIAEDMKVFNPLAMSHPLGMSRRAGEDIRVIHGANPADGSIACLADVPQGALLWMMESDQQSLIDCVDDAYDESLASLGGLPPIGFLAFDCAGRHQSLGPEGLSEELDRLVGKAAGVPLAGFYTYGEVARTRRAQGMHHMTLVMLAFA